MKHYIITKCALGRLSIDFETPKDHLLNVLKQYAVEVGEEGDTTIVSLSDDSIEFIAKHLQNFPVYIRSRLNRRTQKRTILEAKQ